MSTQTQIKDLYAPAAPILSFETFPPRVEAEIANMESLLTDLSALTPDFISVTCGAGGSGALGIYERTVKVSDEIQTNFSIPALAHLTCYNSTQEEVNNALTDLQARGIANVLALRGDIPAESSGTRPYDFDYAYQLIEQIKQTGDFCVGATCYPEGHIDCADLAVDLQHMKRKQDAGADFFISQLCFENDIILSFLDRAHKAGIDKPISVGIMPFLSKGQVERMIYMCGASLPSPVIKILHKYEHNEVDLRKAGIDYCMNQLSGLIQSGVDGVHVYIMNKADTAVAAAQTYKSLS